MPNKKDDNQYFGKYFERALVEKINQTGIIIDPTQYKDTCGYDFSEKDIQDLNKDAEQVGDYIGHNLHAVRTGDHTSLEAGDIHLEDGTILEVKRVSCGTGTYHNTSLYYLVPFGFDLKTYMDKFQLRETIQRLFPKVSVNYKCKSPVNEKNSSYIRNTDVDKFHEIQAIDIEMRKQLVADLVQYFRINPDQAQLFYKDMAFKKKLRQGTYADVDRFILFDYTKHKVNEINLNEIKSNPSQTIYFSDLGFCIGNLRFQIGWQNGNGLNNPTIRAYIK